MTELMTPEQIEEAKNKATVWLSKMKKNSGASTGQGSTKLSELSDPGIRPQTLEGLDS